MSRIVVLEGSMRKDGNTHALVRSFAEGASRNNTVSILTVADLDIVPCTGCNWCYGSEGNRCRIDDDMQLVYEELAQTDVLVIASPVYFYGVSARLKAIVDRLHTPMRNTFKISKLALLLVGATELPDLFDPIILQYRMAVRFFGLGDIGIVTVGGVRDAGDIAGNKALKDAYDLGSSIR